MGKHGRIISHKVIWEDKTEGHDKGRLERAKASDGTEVIHILKPISQKEYGWGFTLFQSHYTCIKTEIKHLVELNGKEEVEKELNIKIQEENE